MDRLWVHKPAFTLMEVLLAVAILALLAGVAMPVVAHLRGGAEADADTAEHAMVQAAVDAMMAFEGINTLPDPVSSPTSDMSAFPDPAYPLFGVPKFMRQATTRAAYSCDADGTVHQTVSGGAPTGTPSPTPTPTPPPGPTPVARWPLDENAGSVAYDAIGSSDGTVYGATWTTGVSGSALSFDGSSRLEIPEIIPDGEFTIVFWFQPDWDGDDDNEYAIFDATDDPLCFFIGKTSNNKLKWHFESANDADMKISVSSSFIESGNWYHVAATGQFSSSGPHKLYVNGSELDSDTKALNQKGQLSSPYVGYYTDTYKSPNSGYSGVIDEVAIYDQVLNGTEIQALYDALRP